MGVSIAVGNRKGGVGKSTIATNLAVAHAKRVGRVKLIDADEQGSSYTWGQFRDENAVEPRIRKSKMAGKIYHDLLGEKEEGDCVVDVGGTDGPELRAAMAACDVFVMPVVPGQFDTWALGRMIMLVRELRESGAKFHAIAVLNNASPHKKSRSVAMSRGVLAKYSDDFILSPTLIVKREAFSNAVCEGRGVAELEGEWYDQKAVDEIDQLYAEVFNVR